MSKGCPFHGFGNGHRLGWRGRLSFTPRDLKTSDGAAESFKVLRVQEDTSSGQSGIIAQQMLVRGLTDKYVAPTGRAFEPAGQIYFTAKDGVVFLLFLEAHQSNCGEAGINAAPQQ